MGVFHQQPKLNKDAITEAPADVFNEFSQLQIDVIGVERKQLSKLHHEGKASEEIIRKMEKELDLEEIRLQWKCTQHNILRIYFISNLKDIEVKPDHGKNLFLLITIMINLKAIRD